MKISADLTLPYLTLPYLTLLTLPLPGDKVRPTEEICKIRNNEGADMKGLADMRQRGKGGEIKEEMKAKKA